MNNPPSDPASLLLSADPASAPRFIPNQADKLLAARRAQRLAEARNLTRRYVLITTGLALLPIPVVDIAALAAIQIKLVHDLAHLYEVPFESKIAKPLLTSLLSCGGVSFGGIALMSLGLSVPGLRTLVGGGFSGSLAGTTLATSEIFIRHFEAGGTLTDFDPVIAPPASPATQISTASTPTADSEQLETASGADGNPREAVSLLDTVNPEPAISPDEQSSATLSSQQEAQPVVSGLQEDRQTEQSSTQDQDQQLLSRVPLHSPLSTIGKGKPEASHPPQIVADLDKISGIGPVYLGRLNKAGVSDSITLAALQPDALKQILGARVSLATARDFISQAKALSRVNSS
jgi:predicted flap endonuclease-1-like 5' DNA nuclease/uncharacterized protein (DUF697 family)